MKYRIKLLLFAPLFKQGGDAVNEGQLINALSKYVESIYCFTFVSFHRIFLKKALKPAVSLNRNVKVIILPRFPLYHIFIFINILYHMLIGFIYVIIEKMIKPDLVYVRGNLIAFSLLTLKSFTNKPIILKFGGFTSDEELLTIKRKQIRGIIERLLWAIDYYTLHRADILLVASDIMKSLVAKRVTIQSHKRTSTKILICPPGVDMNKIYMIKKESKASFVGDKVRIGFIGSLAWWQGVDILAVAVTKVKKKLPNVELFIVGDGPLRERVIEICKSGGVSFKVTGYVPHDVALAYLKNFDVLVLPSRRTSATESHIPIKVVEAWALGVPVIVTSHKIFKSVCKDGEDVVFVKPDPNDVAEKILLVISDSKLREKLSRNGQILARNFNYNEIAKRLLNSIWRDK
jgi:glycosyltransferase involved in cell wall biosynthesis